MVSLNEKLIIDYIKENCAYGNELIENGCKITCIETNNSFVNVSIRQSYGNYYEEMEYNLFDILTFVYSKVIK